jgi:hypothetical protein
VRLCNQSRNLIPSFFRFSCNLRLLASRFKCACTSAWTSRGPLHDVVSLIDRNPILAYEAGKLATRFGLSLAEICVDYCAAALVSPSPMNVARAKTSSVAAPIRTSQLTQALKKHTNPGYE